MMLKSAIVASMLNFMVKRLPNAALMLASARDSGMAPSSMPCGHTYLQKYGSPIPTEFWMRAGRAQTITTRMPYLR